MPITDTERADFIHDKQLTEEYALARRDFGVIVANLSIDNFMRWLEDHPGRYPAAPPPRFGATADHLRWRFGA